MKLHTSQFLGIESPYTDYENAHVVVLPVPYQGGVSYGEGTNLAPEAIIEASHYLELYDEVLELEPYRMGITTVEPISADQSENIVDAIQTAVRELLNDKKYIAMLGGDHSISTGYARAIQEAYDTFSVIQLDAHSDLRESYEGSPYSHASVMARIRELTPHTLQLGIRSMCIEEAERIRKEKLFVCHMDQWRKGIFNLDAALKKLPDPVFITFDVDVMDWSVIASTGTPEPGGLLWDEAIDILTKIFQTKQVIGFDIVELSINHSDRNSPFAVAKLLYKMLGMHYQKNVVKK